MLITHAHIEQLPILSLQTGAPLGRATQPIIDPRKLQVVAFYCEGARIQGTAVLHVDDIREVNEMGLIVNGADDLMPMDGLVRLQEVIDLAFTLIGKPVVTTDKQKLGRVEGYSVDADSFFIMKINVHRPFLQSFLSGNLLIDRTQITEITDRQITVQSSAITREDERTAKKVLNPVLDNPFRRREAPQPNISSADDA